MVSGGVATVFVSDMDRAVRFYSDVLGLKLTSRYGDHWAGIDAGPGLSIGLHPASSENPAGRPGSITIGLKVSQPLSDVVASLERRGVHFRGGIRQDAQAEGPSFAHFTDPDGNELYLAELQQHS